MQSDLNTFKNFYTKHHSSLWNFAKYLTNSPSDADELVNDVFISVWNKRNKLLLDDSLKSYLFRSVKNKSINFHKKKKMKWVENLPHDKLSSFTSDGPLMLKEQNELLQNIMNSLPPKCKQVFAMSRIDELTYAEIASLMDISVKTVEAQISKALKIFREKLRT